MNPVIAVSVIAGGASLVAGISARLLIGLNNDRISRELQSSMREERSSRKAEIRASGRELRASLEFSARLVRRLKMFLVLSFSYFAIAAIEIFWPQKTLDGWQIKILYFAAITVALLAGVLLVIGALEFYSTMRKSQKTMERKVEEVHRLVRR
jgi:hypothetical protein